MKFSVNFDFTCLACIVVVLCASPDTVREIMIAADAMNFNNGEYVFFIIDLFARSDTQSCPP